jgi:hypothetical protein
VQRRSHQFLFNLLSRSSDFFISYRRGQSELAANTLREGLSRKFGKKRVFMDTDAIEPGERWPRRLEEAIATSRAMLVVIGPQWLEHDAGPGARRIDQPGDWVRREIEEGLARPDLAVIPVTHDGASVPAREELPDSMKALSDCQAVTLTGRDIDQWITELVERIQVGRIRSSEALRDRGAGVPAEST